MKRVIAVLVVTGSLFLVACCLSGNGNVDLNPVESFAESDAPETCTFDSRQFTGPWGYKKDENENRSYPLVVSGCWGEGEGQYKAVNRRYPAFVIDYQKNTVSDGEALAEWITNAIAAGYRIDVNRIYLTGFSQGGSGSFPLARGMHNKGKYFAAIIRVAGQSQSDLGNDIATRTAVWYHIGLNDTATRVTVARDALANFRAYACNGAAVETEKTDDVTGHPRTTVTLSRSGFEMFKYSEYTGMGHDSSACYRDGTLFPWMFSQSLALR